MPQDIKEVHDQQSDSGLQPPKKTFTARNTNIGKRETSKSPQFANFCGHSPASLPKWKGVQGRHLPVI